MDFGKALVRILNDGFREKYESMMRMSGLPQQYYIYGWWIYFEKMAKYDNQRKSKCAL